jgi:hypothetical protein
MATNEIPFEVFIGYLLPLLTLKEVGVLSMVNSIWKDLCDDNETWKELYLRTIRANILDTSVHIGPKFRRHRNIEVEHQGGGRVVSVEIFLPWQPCCPLMSQLCQNSYDFFYEPFISGCECMPQELKETLKSYREIRKDSIDCDTFPLLNVNQHHWARRKRDTSEYCDYIKSEWSKYNAGKGLSTVNLCQCLDHYQFDTLGIPGGCRNSKSFKKITLGKLKTQTTQEKKKKEREILKKKQKYDKIMEAARRAEKEYMISKMESANKQNTIDKLECAITSL